MLFSILPLPEHAHIFHVLSIGLLLGSLYAVSFVAQQRRLLLSVTRTYVVPLILMRIVLIAFSSYYLLHLPTTTLIMVGTVAFIAGFWLIILRKRILPHERIGSYK